MACLVMACLAWTVRTGWCLTVVLDSEWSDEHEQRLDVTAKAARLNQCPNLPQTADGSRFVREVVKWYRRWVIAQTPNANSDQDNAQHLLGVMRAIAQPFFQSLAVYPLLPAVSDCLAAELSGLRSLLQQYTFVPDERGINPQTHAYGLTPAILETVLEQLLAVSTGAADTTDTLRKQTGTFFTPVEVVNAMVERGLQPFLADRDPQKVVTAIAHLKCCDPACGAGAFPIALLHQLMQMLAKYDPDNHLWREVQSQKIQQAYQPVDLKQRAIAIHHTVFNQLPACFSRCYYLLEHCLWGMDIQTVAVLVTQIRCQLMLLTTLQHHDCSHLLLDSIPLPQLHFQVGDSLLDAIGPEETSASSSGFDLVITNPPHLDSEIMTRLQTEARSRYQQCYATARGNWDLFVVFIERGLQLLRPGGILAYIVPNKLVGAPYARTLRALLAQHRILELRDYAAVRVFREAHVYPVVAMVQKAVPQTAVTMVVMHDCTTAGSQHQIPAHLFYRDWEWDRYFGSEAVLHLLTKCAAVPSLQQVFPHVVGAATVGEAYALKELIQEAADLRAPLPAYKKLINTGTIDPYCVRWGEQATRYLGDRYRQPIILDAALQQFSQARFRQAAAAKLVIGGIGRRLEAVYDGGEYLAGKSTLVIWNAPPEALQYLLALLNSSLLTVWYRAYFRSFRLANGYFRIGKQAVQSLPLAIASDAQQRAIVHCVEQLLQRDRLSSSQVTALHQELDHWVCQLYGVTPEEVAIATLELC